ncbi:mannose-P-dolichol utilization defect 1 [Fusarium tjaetaba]|uniref:Mannose-P-dolichol utilization defect 1 protein homolog n=1 Tax=Fusarium tjaetaba TaxID=1567544 RepID=A0A8H5S7L1_9HYPO|nr:mannose-P-dolichol utilization defect 1 [Fusarium tjaetaba]KAF5647589.1 mannose-P-dolichol utilization defect 1 [Fusarium tjaetaba]
MDALKSAITPITHNLPAPIRDLGVSIIGETCYKSLLLDVNIEDAECIKFAVSKALGIGIIAASSIVKVPQILKLINSKSAEGVSFLSYLLETASYIISLAYNFRNGFPFSTYGETALIVGQNVIISVLVLNYSGRASLAAVFVAALAGTVATLFAENVVDAQTLSYLQAGAGALGVASKLPQILTIFQQGGTGQLSAFAVFNYLAGSLSRIFTTLQEVDDKLILYGFVSGFVLNAILALQMIFYWNAPSEKAKGKQPVAPIAAKPAVLTPSSSTTATPKKSPTTRRRG